MIGKKIKNKDKGAWISQMEAATLENGKMIKFMASDESSGKAAPISKASFGMELRMEKEYFNGKMVNHMKGSLRMEIYPALEHSNGLMVKNMYIRGTTNEKK